LRNKINISMTTLEKMQSAKVRVVSAMKARPWLTAGTAIILVLGIVYVAKGSPAPAVEVVRAPIAVQTIALAGLDEAQTEVTTSGIIESLDQVEMKSESFGTVTRVNAKVGQTVRSGAILVQLDTKSIDAQLSQASAGLSRAQASLNARLAGATDEQIAQSQAGLDAANAQFALTVSSMDAAVEQAKIAEESALLALQNAQAGIGLGDDSALTGAENTARSSFASAMNTLAVITDYQYRYFYCTSDQICRDIENAKEDAVRTLVGASDAGQWTMTSISQQQGGIFADLENLSPNSATYSDDLVAVLQKETDALRDLQVALSSVRTGLETALAANATSAEKASVEIEQSGIDALIATVSGTAQSVVALPVTAKTSVDAAKSAYDRAVAARIASEDQRVANIALAESSVASAQAGYNATVADPRSVDIAGLERQVREARASIAILSAQREKLILRAPF
jgi:multidrug efflux pump subunit AcrA (membrane-fusion protein)